MISDDSAQPRSKHELASSSSNIQMASSSSIIPSSPESLLEAVVSAYTNLTRDQLVLFSAIRRLPVDGSSLDLAHRLAKHDLEVSPVVHTFPSPPEPTPDVSAPCDLRSDARQSIPTLPAEILADIMDWVGDWELSKALGVSTSIKRPKEWAVATCLDEAVLLGSIPYMISTASSTCTSLTPIGASALVRLGYIHVLDYLCTNDRPTFDRLYSGVHSRLIPLRASCSGRTEVLSWWRAQEDIPKDYGDDCIDEACRHCQLDVLEWWKSSSGGLPLQYTEAALENASARGHLSVLSWWKQSGLPLKVGRVMDLASKSGHVDVLDWWRTRSGIEVKCDSGTLEHASRSGRVDVLEWWRRSGLQMIFNEDVLIGGTRHNRAEVLQWWYNSGLPVHYRICDIEEALEDAIRPGPESRQWWARLGVDFKEDNSEWMKLKTLRHVSFHSIQTSSDNTLFHR